MNQADRPDSPLGVLMVLLPDGRIQNIPLPRPVVTVGRHESNDIQLKLTKISRRHVRLTIEKDQVFVEDLGSSNGTFIDGVRLAPEQPTLLKPGQVLFLGSIQTSIRVNPPPMKSVPEAPPRQTWRSVLANRNAILSSGIRWLKIQWRWVAGLGSVVLVGLVGLAVYGIVQSIRGQADQEVALVSSTSATRGQATRAETPAFTVTLTKSSLPTSTWTVVAVPTPSATGTPTSQPPTASPTMGIQLPATAFLELPFPYDGGNENFGGTDEQFRRASQRNLGRGSGRVNSFFDHMFPLYPAPKDPSVPGGKEPAEPPAGGSILLYWGQLDSFIDYSGHPGLDFSTYIRGQPTTPVFAAADGTIMKVSSQGAGGAYYITIKHTVPGVGDFETIYWHLNPDMYFDQMLGSESQPIKAGTRIGTMGNTGFSTGHHLHFEVRFDNDRNGEFPPGEAVDPYGWISSPEYPKDPWTVRTGIVDNYLWKHPLGSQFELSPGGSVAESEGVGGEVPSQPGFTLPSGGTLYYSWIPDPDRTTDLIGANNGYAIYVKDAQGKLLSRFDPPITINIPFSLEDIVDISPTTLAIYCREEGEQEWQRMRTSLNLQQMTASASISTPGQCNLMGKPTRDLTLPRSIIKVLGERAQDGTLFGSTSIDISAFDASGIAAIYFSLDQGTTWNKYDGTLTLDPNGIPWKSLTESEFLGGSGTFTVLAYSVDNAGNVEDPPVYINFAIDPTKNPNIDQSMVATLIATMTGGDPSRLSTLDPNEVSTLVATLIQGPLIRTPTPTRKP